MKVHNIKPKINIKIKREQENEFLSERWFKDYKNNLVDVQYEGMKFDHKKQKKKVEDTKYSNYTSMKNIFGKEIQGPLKDEPISDFMKRVGISSKENIIKIDTNPEGSIGTYAASIHKQICIDNNIESVVEVGFNEGISTANFLDIKDDEDQYLIKRIISFDIMIHWYSHYAELAIANKYPKRNMLIAGDSKQTIPFFTSNFPSTYDLIFIDGDHSYLGAYKDIKNCMKFAHKNTLLIIDNIVPHRGVGIGVYQAFLKHYRDGNLTFIEHYKIPTRFSDYWDGFILCKYRSEDDKIKEVPYKEIESMIDTTYYSKRLEEEKINSKLVKLKQEIRNKIDNGELIPDKFLLDKLGKD